MPHSNSFEYEFLYSNISDCDPYFSFYIDFYSCFYKFLFSIIGVKVADIFPLEEKANNPWILVFYTVEGTQVAVKALKKRGVRVFSRLVRAFIEENPQESSQPQVKPLKELHFPSTKLFLTLLSY